MSDVRTEPADETERWQPSGDRDHTGARES
jgi:hypothetical protein